MVPAFTASKVRHSQNQAQDDLGPVKRTIPTNENHLSAAFEVKPNRLEASCPEITLTHSYLKPMKQTRTPMFKELAFALLIGGTLAAQAVNVTKLNTTTMNGGVADWSAAPGTADVGEFGATPTASTLLNMTLGGPLTLGGLQLNGTMNGPLTITDAATLTLNGSGINMSAANQDLTLNCGLLVNANQSWSITGGRALNIGGSMPAFTGGKVLTVGGAGTVTLPAVNTGNGTGGLIVTMTGGSLTSPDVNIQRYGASTTTAPTATTPVAARTDSGFYVNGTTATVNLGSLQISTGNAGGSGRIDAGNVTVTNNVVIGRSDNGSATATGRGAYFQVNGGSFTSLDALLGVVLGQNAANGDQNLAEFYVSAGTATVERMAFGAATDVNGGRSVLILKGTGSLYMGAGGIVLDTPVSGYNAIIGLYSGVLGAADEWSSSMPMVLSGPSDDPFVIKAADAGNTAHNITLTGGLTGTGGLLKSGAGTLTLGGANNYSGKTEISQGKLALDASGTLSSSIQIGLAAGTTFDASAPGGFTLVSAKTLVGAGTVIGNVTCNSGSTIIPGSGIGSLTFSNDLAWNGGVSTLMELASSSNDVIEVSGSLSLSGLNPLNLVLVGGNLNAGTYDLIHYGTSLIGDVSSLDKGKFPGYLTNRADVQRISLVTPGLRGATNVVWVGNALTNDWDVLNVTNWLSGAGLDFFIQGDTALFNDVGSANATVNITETVLPAEVIVNATADYTLSGTGSIGGTGGLTKTNSGKLTIQAVNGYSGATAVKGGTLSVSTVANSGVPSTLGAATSDPSKLVINGGTLEFTGATQSTDRGATIDASGGTIAITNETTSLTISGTVTGSGLLTKLGAGNLILGGVNSYGGVSLASGLLEITGASGVASALSGPVNFNGGSLKFSVGGQPSFSNPLLINTAGTLIAAGGNNNIVTGPWSGAATLALNMSSGGTFTINGDMTTNFTGTIALTDTSSGTFRFNGGGNASGTQQSTGSAAAAFNLGNSTVTLLNRNGGSISNGIYELGALSGGSSTIVRGASNGGQPENASYYSIGAKNLATTFAGTFQNGTGGAGATTSIIKVGTNVLTLTGPNTYTGATIISNGVLTVTQDTNTLLNGSIESSLTVNVVSGAVLDVSGRSDGTLNQNSAAHTLVGSGTVRGSVTSFGTVSPGASIGTLTITNVASLSGTVLMELNTANGPQTNDLIIATVINGGGTLNLTNIGPRLQVGQRFVLFSTPVSGGLFINPLPDADGTTYTFTNDLASDGSVTVATVAPIVDTNPTNITVSFSGGILTLSWPESHIGWTLEAQTNALSTGLNTNWVSLGYEGTNSVGVTINPTNPTVFYRLTYLIP